MAAIIKSLDQGLNLKMFLSDGFLDDLLNKGTGQIRAKIYAKLKRANLKHPQNGPVPYGRLGTVRLSYKNSLKKLDLVYQNPPA